MTIKLTREEAIQDLKAIKSFERYARGRLALDMAIEALKGEDHDGCDGCRYEANDEYMTPCNKCKQNYKDEYKPKPKHDRDWIVGCIKHDGFIKTDRGDKANQIILEALKADRPRGEWIPCSERMPENGHYYLWCSDMGNVQSDYYWNGFENGMKYKYNIIAWTPLPEPYKGGEDK